MRTFITVVYNMFALKQKIYVYINGECKEVVQHGFKDLEIELYKLCQKYNIQKIYLEGGKPYALKTKERFMNKYEDNKFELIIIDK